MDMCVADGLCSGIHRWCPIVCYVVTMAGGCRSDEGGGREGPWYPLLETVTVDVNGSMSVLMDVHTMCLISPHLSPSLSGFRRQVQEARLHLNCGKLDLQRIPVLCIVHIL